MFANTVEKFFTTIANEVMKIIDAGIDILLIPVGLGFCGFFFVNLLLKAIADYNDNRGDEIKGKILWLALIVIVAVLLLTKKTWWALLFVG